MMSLCQLWGSNLFFAYLDNVAIGTQTMRMASNSTSAATSAMPKWKTEGKGEVPTEAKWHRPEIHFIAAACELHVIRMESTMFSYGILALSSTHFLS